MRTPLRACSVGGVRGEGGGHEGSEDRVVGLVGRAGPSLVVVLWILTLCSDKPGHHPRLESCPHDS